jgi:excisionase family DNA binding protein
MALSKNLLNPPSSIKGIHKLLATEEVAAILGVKVETLAIWRHTKRYNLPFVKVGRLCRYRPEDVERFVSARTVGA